MSQAGVPPGQGNPPGYGRPPSPATPQGPAGGGGQKGGTLPMSAVPDLAGYAPNQPGAANYGASPNQPGAANYGASPNQPGAANYGAGHNYAAPANQGAAQNYAYSPGPVAPGQHQVAPGYPMAPQGYAPDPRASRAAPVGSPTSTERAKRSSVGLVLVLGGIGVIALIAAGAGAYWYRQRAVSLERQLAEVAASRNGALRSEPLAGDCKKAYDCCVAIASKAEVQSILAQCEVFKLAGRQPSECSTALVGYRKVATSNGLSCD